MVGIFAFRVARRYGHVFYAAPNEHVAFRTFNVFGLYTFFGVAYGFGRGRGLRPGQYCNGSFLLRRAKLFAAVIEYLRDAEGYFRVALCKRLERYARAQAAFAAL